MDDYDIGTSKLDALLAEVIVEPRQSRSREKMERMLAVGRDLLAEVGYERLRVEDVCERSDANMMSFHNRFGTKDNFFAAILLRHAKKTFSNVERGRPGFPREGISLREELLLFTALVFAHYRADRKLMGAFLRYSGSNAVAREGMTLSNHAIKKQFRWHMAPHLGAITHPNPEVALRLAAELPINLALQMLVLDPGPIHLDDPDLAPNVADAMHRILAGRLSP